MLSKMFCLSNVIWFILPFIILKLYWKLNTRWNKSQKCLIGKTVLVTGANVGIGYHVALDFAKRGARVILGCRNKTKAEEAQRRIINETENDNIVVKLIDMESFESVRSFAKEFNNDEDRLDILVNNAGISGLDYETKDGYPVVMQVNHLSPFLLTNLLIDKLKKSAPSRIVIVASNMVQFGRFKPKNLGLRPRLVPPFVTVRLYANSKLCNAVFAQELAKRLNGTGVIANAVHPGVIPTQIFSYYGFLFYSFMHLMTWLLKTAEEGAQTVLHAAVSNDAGKIGGRFFNNCQDVGHYRNAMDPQFGREVWLKSEELVHLADEEKQHRP